MLEEAKVSRQSKIKDYGELIRMVTRKTMAEMAKDLGVSLGMISAFELGRSGSKRLLNAYNEYITRYNLEVIYDEICNRREMGV